VSDSSPKLSVFISDIYVYTFNNKVNLKPLKTFTWPPFDLINKVPVKENPAKGELSLDKRNSALLQPFMSDLGE